jgi:heme-degrading monooxygenase HmoA
MMAVIFEVTPKSERRQDYLDAAARLGAHLKDADGFISVERFESLTTPGKLLSLSFWRDEEALANWRRFEFHRRMQEMGRNHFFADYRLRIAGVVRDYGMIERDEAPADSRAHHDGAAAPLI